MSNHHEQPQVITIKFSPDWFIFVSNFVIWVSDLRILSLGLQCILLDFFCGIRERRTGDSRNDVRLSPGGIVRHVNLEIKSFADDISLYFVVVSLFRVGAPFFGFDFFFALHCSYSSSAMWDLVVGFPCIFLDFLCGCWWC